MFLVSVRTPFFCRSLPAADAREALQTLWMFAGQGFDIVVLDERGEEMVIRQLEALAGGQTGCDVYGGRRATSVDSYDFPT